MILNYKLSQYVKVYRLALTPTWFDVCKHCVLIWLFKYSLDFIYWSMILLMIDKQVKENYNYCIANYQMSTQTVS